MGTIDRKLWIVVQGRQKNQEVILPVIETGSNVDILFPVISLSDTAQQYPEQWNVARFMQRTADNPARKFNADLLIEVLEEIKKAIRKNKGKPERIQKQAILQTWDILLIAKKWQRRHLNVSVILLNPYLTYHLIEEKEFVRKKKAAILTLHRKITAMSPYHSFNVG